ncbi:MAG TPA: septal ring lytic transglycosylase RlpA family protein [Candidatus Sulfotelmatobacter sp.]|jgi:rare lipoprotein A|nr:septal ring lytic transglycosylase RlpA family protein [Candidatus Sulfotelmatobacter sp.]
MKRRLPHARILVLMAGCALLAACSETQLATYGVKEAIGQDTRGGVYKVGKPYQIQGVWYYPTEDYNYSETGIASWYGPDFHGKYTANGEVFDQNDVTAAHRTLPLPSFVRVTNLDNGRSLVVRVNDRGPFAHGRILDLSKRAAQLLGMEGTGTAKVKVEIMADESRQLAAVMKAKQQLDEPPIAAAPRDAVVAENLPMPGKDASKPAQSPQPVVRAAPPPSTVGAVVAPDSSQLAKQEVKQTAVKPTQIFIQAGAFSRFDNANRMNSALQPYGNSAISQVQTKGGTLFRVRLGPIANVGDADALLEKVIGAGYPDARLIVD